MHLAAAAGTPTLGLFGPTDAAEYAPAGPRTLAVVGPDRDMAAISVEAAFEATTYLLARPPNHGQEAFVAVRPLAVPAGDQAGPGGMGFVTRPDRHHAGKAAL
jgi:hypothetical protein